MCPHAHIQREEIFGDREIRCLLVHDHVLLRQGLRRLLEDEPDIEVVAEAGNAAEALQRVFEHRPEVVITDPHIFECAPDQTERLILHESPHSKVLFLATHHENTAGSAGKRDEMCGAADLRGRIGGDGEEDALPARKRRCERCRKDAAENGCRRNCFRESAF